MLAFGMGRRLVLVRYTDKMQQKILKVIKKVSYPAYNVYTLNMC